MYAMDAKEIIIKLVDTGKITGEEAAVLFEAIYTKFYYWPYYKADYEIGIPYRETKTDEAPSWQKYQSTSNKDTEGTGVASNTGLYDAKPWKETCDN